MAVYPLISFLSALPVPRVNISGLSQKTASDAGMKGLTDERKYEFLFSVKPVSRRLSRSPQLESSV